ncbi:hypothetical protein [Acetobacterium wieringae]
MSWCICYDITVEFDYNFVTTCCWLILCAY